MTLLTPAQRQLAELLSKQPSAPPAVTGALPDGSAAADAVAATTATEAEATELRGLGQLGLPLRAADVSSLLAQSLSEAVGQNVQFQPFVFNNIFQVRLWYGMWVGVGGGGMSRCWVEQREHSGCGGAARVRPGREGKGREGKRWQRPVAEQGGGRAPSGQRKAMVLERGWGIPG